MTAETVAYSTLAAAGAVTAIVGTKIYPDNVPEKIPSPSLVIDRVDTEPVNTIHTGAAVASRVLTELWCMSTSRLAADTLADVVEDAIVVSEFTIVDRRTEWVERPQADGLWSTVVTVAYWEV